MPCSSPLAPPKPCSLFTSSVASICQVQWSVCILIWPCFSATLDTVQHSIYSKHFFLLPFMTLPCPLFSSTSLLVNLLWSCLILNLRFSPHLRLQKPLYAYSCKICVSSSDLALPWAPVSCSIPIPVLLSLCLDAFFHLHLHIHSSFFSTLTTPACVISNGSLHCIAFRQPEAHAGDWRDGGGWGQSIYSKAPIPVSVGSLWLGDFNQSPQLLAGGLQLFLILGSG